MRWLSFCCSSTATSSTTNEANDVAATGTVATNIQFMSSAGTAITMQPMTVIDKACRRYSVRLGKLFGIARRAAARKAATLFADLFGKRTLEALRRDKRIEVVAASGRRYVVPKDGCVYWKGDDGKPAEHYCVMPDGPTPVMDAVILRLLLLKSGAEGEQLFLKKANR